MVSNNELSFKEKVDATVMPEILFRDLVFNNLFHKDQVLNIGGLNVALEEQKTANQIAKMTEKHSCLCV